MSRDELGELAALRAGKRRWLWRIAGNLLLLLGMLGLPQLRGYLRTRALWSAFARYGACLFGGAPADSPGLGMPAGHEAHFAQRALSEPGWTARCEPELAALAPEPAFFVMPGVKTAENDLRAAVALVRSELAQLVARPPGAALPVRPLRAIERLRAGLANHALAAGAFEVPQREAFTLPKAARLPTPSRLPLAAGASAQVSLWGGDGELAALALDHAGIAYLRLRGGALEQSRSARPKLLQAALPLEAPGSFVWAMPVSRCRERANLCADKALGVAPIELPPNPAPVPRWLGAHPAGRLDRSFFRAEARVVIAAQTASGAAELREFALEPGPPPSAELPPLAAARTWARELHGQVLLLAAQREPLAWLAASGASGATLSELTPAGARSLAQLEAADAPWVVGCSDQTGLGFAFGHERALILGERAASGEVRQFAPVALALREVVDAADRARDRAVRACGLGSHAALVARDPRDRLLLVACDRSAGGCTIVPLASAVHGFTALAFRERLIVAYAGGSELSQIRVRSISLDAVERADEQLPAPCWSDRRGLCGPPLLARAGDRVLLAAREGSDLRVLESHDAGQSWQPLTGLNGAR